MHQFRQCRFHGQLRVFRQQLAQGGKQVLGFCIPSDCGQVLRIQFGNQPRPDATVKLIDQSIVVKQKLRIDKRLGVGMIDRVALGGAAYTGNPQVADQCARQMRQVGIAPDRARVHIHSRLIVIAIPGESVTVGVQFGVFQLLRRPALYLQAVRRVQQKFTECKRFSQISGYSTHVKDPLVNSNKPVIASVARQSHAMESVSWRLPRHFVPRNDELIRGSLKVYLYIAGLAGMVAYGECMSSQTGPGVISRPLSYNCNITGVYCCIQWCLNIQMSRWNESDPGSGR